MLDIACIVVAVCVALYFAIRLALRCYFPRILDTIGSNPPRGSSA